MTIQSALSIDLETTKYKNLNGQNLIKKRKLFKDIEYICIDEISLVSKCLLS